MYKVGMIVKTFNGYIDILIYMGDLPNNNISEYSSEGLKIVNDYKFNRLNIISEIFIGEL